MKQRTEPAYRTIPVPPAAPPLRGNALTESWTDTLQKQGIHAASLPLRRLPDVQAAVENLRDHMDEAFFQEFLSGFRYDPPEDLPETGSIIVTATADFPVRFTFSTRRGPASIVVPPTYLHWNTKNQQAKQALLAALSPRGYQVMDAHLPKKTLAVRSGLAACGRSNITYVPGFGSFHRLEAFFSDMPCAEDPWREPVLLERCRKCEACLRACPTAAIAPDRFLLYAERCLTFWNEKPADVPFPKWINPALHNSLVGCMLCQQVCPENKSVRYQVQQGCTFDEEETRLLLHGSPQDDLPPSLLQKLQQWDLLDWLDQLPRNLQPLLNL